MGAFSMVACWTMRHWVHGPLLHMGSQAQRRHESQASNAKCLVKVKCSTSMHQAIMRHTITCTIAYFSTDSPCRYSPAVIGIRENFGMRGLGEGTEEESVTLWWSKCYEHTPSLRANSPLMTYACHCFSVHLHTMNHKWINKGVCWMFICVYERSINYSHNSTENV